MSQSKHSRLLKKSIKPTLRGRNLLKMMTTMLSTNIQLMMGLLLLHQMEEKTEELFLKIREILDPKRQVMPTGRVVMTIPEKTEVAVEVTMTPKEESSNISSKRSELEGVAKAQDSSSRRPTKIGCIISRMMIAKANMELKNSPNTRSKRNLGRHTKESNKPPPTVVKEVVQVLLMITTQQIRLPNNNKREEAAAEVEAKSTTKIIWRVLRSPRCRPLEAASKRGVAIHQRRAADNPNV
jgi:hypothetical protein